jgi:hypothetical protein
MLKILKTELVCVEPSAVYLRDLAKHHPIKPPSTDFYSSLLALGNLVHSHKTIFHSVS